MRAHPLVFASISAVLGVLVACSGSEDASPGSSSGTTGASSSGASSTSSSGASSTSSSGASGSTSSSSGASGDAGGTTAADPTKDGPFTTTQSDATVAATQTTEELSIRAVVPGQGPSAGPFPVVVFAPGFRIPVLSYVAYATRLASHGIATLLVDYPSGLTDTNVARDARNLSAALAWAKTPGGALAGKLDTARAALMGHSRGGKAAVLAAVADAGFKALLALDPVDSKPPLPCDTTTECPDASTAISTLKVPFLVLGETLDGTGNFGSACAPTADNFTTFYTSAPSPAVEVTVTGAGHVSFVPDQQGCGSSCSFCKAPTRDLADVVGLTNAYAVAFFRKVLGAESGWDTFLTGAEAQTRWVTPGIATIRSK